jgi:hypothetical protein
VIFNSARLVRCGESLEQEEAERTEAARVSRRRGAGRAAPPG